MDFDADLTLLPVGEFHVEVVRLAVYFDVEPCRVIGCVDFVALEFRFEPRGIRRGDLFVLVAVVRAKMCARSGLPELLLELAQD